MAGYSGTPLPQKLGLAKLSAAENAAIAFINAPPEVMNALGVTKGTGSGKRLDFVLLFVKSNFDLRKKFPALAKKLAPAGMVWVAWPKKSSGIVSDLTENVIRDFGLKNGLVDVKVCAITEVWSGLKFVIRLKDRGQRA